MNEEVGKTPGSSIASLVLGLISLLCAWFGYGALISIITGRLVWIRRINFHYYGYHRNYSRNQRQQNPTNGNGNSRNRSFDYWTRFIHYCFLRLCPVYRRTDRLGCGDIILNAYRNNIEDRRLNACLFHIA